MNLATNDLLGTLSLAIQPPSNRHPPLSLATSDLLLDETRFVNEALFTDAEKLRLPLQNKREFGSCVSTKNSVSRLRNRQ